jgi:hypothetical protein
MQALGKRLQTGGLQGVTWAGGEGSHYTTSISSYPFFGLFQDQER